MIYPHLYIKALLQEVKEQNEKMINNNNEYVRRTFSNFHPEDCTHIAKQIEEITLYIEQLNQEIVTTSKLIGQKL